MILFLVILLGLFVVECVLTEVERFGWATLTLTATLVGLGWFGHLHWFGLPSLLEIVRDHGLWTLAYVGAYVVAGIVWSFVKWFSFLMGFRDTFRTEKDKFLAFKKLPAGSALSEEGQAEFIKGFSADVRYGRRGLYDDKGNPIKYDGWTASVFEYRGNALNERPRASKNKARITAWASFWPFSFVGTVLNDPVRRLFNFLFDWFKSLYQKMSDQIFSKDVELK